jgi:hypothetical protein
VPEEITAELPGADISICPGELWCCTGDDESPKLVYVILYEQVLIELVYMI